jgi:hypothetical protein
MSTNKRHSRGGMKPLRQRGRARNQQQRDAENLAALARYKAPAEDVIRDHLAGIDAQREQGRVRRERPLVRRFNPLALALCVALIGGDK